MNWLLLPLIFVALTVNASDSLQNQTMLLDDGRTLGYAEYGDVDGYPVMYFHGGQESRLSAEFLSATARDLGIRLIAPERPGIGLSSESHDRIFTDWGADVSALAERLELKKFSVFGLSGGAPHVLAVLLGIPDQVHRAAIVSGAIPYDAPRSTKGMWFPVKVIHFLAKRKDDGWLRKIMLDEKNTLDTEPEKKVEQFQKHLNKPDRKLMNENPEFAWQFMRGSQEAFRQGIDGVVQEWRLYVRPWDMDLNSIETPVSLWYGKEDKMAPVYRGRYLNSELKNSELFEFEDEGHFSLIYHQQEAILRSLLP